MTNSTVSTTSKTRKAARSKAVYGLLVRLDAAGTQGLLTSELGVAVATAKTQVKGKGLVRVEKVETGKQGRPQFRWILTAHGTKAAKAARNVIAAREAAEQAAAQAKELRAAKRAAKAQAKTAKLAEVANESAEQTSTDAGELAFLNPDA